MLYDNENFDHHTVSIIILCSEHQEKRPKMFFSFTLFKPLHSKYSMLMISINTVRLSTLVRSRIKSVYCSIFFFICVWIYFIILSFSRFVFFFVGSFTLNECNFHESIFFLFVFLFLFIAIINTDIKPNIPYK